MSKEFDQISPQKTAELLDVEQSKPRNALSEFVNTAVYTATSAPLRGLAQIADHNLKTDVFDKSVKGTFEAIGVKAPEAAQFNTSSWYAQQLGGAVGMTVPFLALRGGVKAGAGVMLGESVAMKSALDVGVTHSLSRFAMQEAALSGTAGLLYGSLLNPSDEKLVGTEAFAKDRLKHGVSDLAVFGSLSLASPYIGKGLAVGSTFLETKIAAPLVKDTVAATLRGPLLPGALSGVPAGLVAAEASALRDGRLLPTGQELKENITGMVVVGGTMSSAHWLGAQREGTNTTNARHYADKMGLTQPADSRVANFQVVEGKDQLSRFHQELKAGSENAQAQVVVRQRLETLSSALQGPAGTSLGDARVLQLEHRANGIMPARTAGSFGLIGTCSILDGNVGARDVFTGRSGSIDRTVMLTPRADYQHFSLSLGKGSAEKVSSMPASERLAAVALGEEPADTGKTAAPADAAKSELAEIRMPRYRRWTGPSENIREEAFNIFGTKLDKSDSTVVGFTKDGAIKDLNRASSAATFGRDANGWPYMSVDFGRELWSLNGKPLEAGKVFLDAKAGDKLVFDGSLVFGFQNKGFGGPEGWSNEFQLHYSVDRGLARRLAPNGDASSPAVGPGEASLGADRGRGRDGDRPFRDRDFRDRDGRDRDRGGDRFGRDAVETKPENLRPPRPNGDFEIGEGKFRVLGKMLVRPGDHSLLPLFKNGQRGTVMKNDSVAKFGLDADGKAYFQVNHGQEMWSLNGAPLEAKKPYPISSTDKLIFNGHEFDLSTKRTPHGQEALDLGIKPKQVAPTASPQAATSESVPAADGTVSSRALKPDLNLVPQGLWQERSYIATPDRLQTLMGGYELAQKELMAKRAAELAAAEQAAANRPVETESAENKTNTSESEPAKPGEPAEVRPSESEGKNEVAEAEGPATNTSVPEEAGTGSTGVDALLQTPLDSILKPIVLTDEAAASKLPIDAVKGPEARISNPAELMETDRVSINGKDLARGKELKIGRFQGIDIQLKQDPTIAQMHGYIGMTADGQLYIRDASSTGMFVNGQAIDRGSNVMIKPNDAVTVGRNNRAIEIKVDRPE